MTGSFRLRIGIISMVGIISVVIGGFFGGGDHFDGGNHFGGGTDPRNAQFFRWILLAVSHCKIMDTVRHRLHPALRLLKEHYGFEN